MGQPFRNGHGTFGSTFCHGLLICYEEDRIVFQTAAPYVVLSSAVHGGGFGSANRFVNWKVPLDYNCDDPVRDYGQKLRQWGYAPEAAIGLLTAAKLTHASVTETSGDGYSMLCCVTAGTSNAARAGLARRTFPGYEPGTINIFLFIDGNLTPAAMVNVVLTATEAKAAALQDCGIVDHLHPQPATGTTTDAIVVASSQTDRYTQKHLYAGAATTLGNALGRLVYDAVSEAVRTQDEA